MRSILFSCLALTLVSLAIYAIHSFYSLGSYGGFSPVSSTLTAQPYSAYPVASIGDVFRNL
ncbi:hypothetical protein [Pseudomonas sp. Q1]|uniref:hypothetical protein n=1 Tax=Pseudomonas sp. Q1 TaxID=2202823 RepID=UPI00137534F8|nr:hypothetical protein [Pseudomonas sp. Q1]NCE83701.1 hypothetical protein [Pseudomonas sp. Q1]